MSRTALALTLAVVVTLIAAAQMPSGADEPPASPLAAYPGFGHDTAADEANFEAEEVAREELVAACMARQGFRYVPAPSIALEPGTTREEYAALMAENPNEAHAAGLPAGEREAYYVALTGTADPYSPDAADSPDPTRAGCIGEAHQAIPGVYAAFGALLEEYEAMRRDVERDPQVRRAERRWAACMRAAGHAFASPAELMSSVDRQIDEALQRGARPDVQRLEVEQAAAVAQARSCDGEAQLERVFQQVRAEHEAAFVRRHRDVLEAHR